MQTHNRNPIILAALIGVALPLTSQAGLPEWQNAVMTLGTPPAAHYFDTVVGTAPLAFDVGPLSGDRSFEFIVNAGLGGASSALLGGGSSAQALKFEQWSDTGVAGVTAYGLADYSSTVALPLNTTTHVAFVSNGSSTDLYVSGAYAYTFSGFALNAAGITGLAGAYSLVNGSFGDPLDGSIFGFASYDTVLPAGEIAQHAAALAVPEPSSVVLLGLSALGLARRRRQGD